MEPKTKERLIAFRRANKKLPARRLNIPAAKVSYLNPEFLSKFTTETGKIMPRRITGVSAKLHRKITREIKHARAINLMP
ncbi:MAG: 30S ribosomal protein S18 [Verrucomicrobiota bacterium]